MCSQLVVDECSIVMSRCWLSDCTDWLFYLDEWIEIMMMIAGLPCLICVMDSLEIFRSISTALQITSLLTNFRQMKRRVSTYLAWHQCCVIPPHNLMSHNKCCNFHPAYATLNQMKNRQNLSNKNFSTLLQAFKFSGSMNHRLEFRRRAKYGRNTWWS